MPAFTISGGGAISVSYERSGISPLDRLSILLADNKEPILGAATLQMLLDENRIPDTYGRVRSDAGYVETYDYYRAAAAGWRMKAAQVASAYTIQVEGKILTRKQMIESFLEMAKQMSRRAQPRSISFERRSPYRDSSYVGNLDDCYC